LKSFKDRLDQTTKSFDFQLKNSENIIRDNCFKTITHHENNTLSSLNDMSLRITEVKLENNKYAYELKQYSDTIIKEIESFNTLKEDLNKKYDISYYNLQNLHKNTENDFEKLKQEFNLLHSKFSDLSEFIKDVRFRRNLGGSNAKKRDFKKMANKLETKGEYERYQGLEPLKEEHEEEELNHDEQDIVKGQNLNKDQEQGKTKEDINSNTPADNSKRSDNQADSNLSIPAKISGTSNNKDNKDYKYVKDNKDNKDVKDVKDIKDIKDCKSMSLSNNKDIVDKRKESSSYKIPDKFKEEDRKDIKLVHNIQLMHERKHNITEINNKCKTNLIENDINSNSIINKSIEIPNPNKLQSNKTNEMNAKNNQLNINQQDFNSNSENENEQEDDDDDEQEEYEEDDNEIDYEDKPGYTNDNIEIKEDDVKDKNTRNSNTINNNKIKENKVNEDNINNVNTKTNTNTICLDSATKSNSNNYIKVIKDVKENKEILTNSEINNNQVKSNIKNRKIEKEILAYKEDNLNRDKTIDLIKSNKSINKTNTTNNTNNTNNTNDPNYTNNTNNV